MYNSEDCKRQLVVIGGENYYIAVGERFVQATIPRENSVCQDKTREIVETLCDAITELMGGSNG